MNADLNCAVCLRRPLALALLTTALSLGCGSSGDETPTTPSGNPSVILNLRVMTTGASPGWASTIHFAEVSHCSRLDLAFAS
jgi:hypothetical protein